MAGRVIVNAAELRRNVSTDSVLAGHVTFVELEDMALTEQLALFSSSVGVVGVHGQGLAWTPFLPAHRTACALLELHPRQMGRQGTHAFFDWMRWSEMSGVRYLASRLEDARECQRIDFRTCGNVTADMRLLHGSDRRERLPDGSEREGRENSLRGVLAYTMKGWRE